MSTLKTNQLDFLRPFTVAYLLPSGKWYSHYHQDEDDVVIIVESVLRLNRDVRVRHDSSGMVLSISGLDGFDIALKCLHLFYIRINDRSSKMAHHRDN